MKKTKMGNIIANISDLLNSTSKLNNDGLSPENTAFVCVDAVNGFCKTGPMYSPRVEGKIQGVVKAAEKFKDYKKIFFLDTHKSISMELNTFPPHCIDGTKEAELIDELKIFLDDKAVICRKNCTNGYLSPDYADWLKYNPEIKNFVVAGFVTDICVMQYCLSQRAALNQKDIEGRVILAVNAVETYSLDELNHNADLMNLFAMYNMNLNGIELAVI